MKKGEMLFTKKEDVAQKKQLALSTLYKKHKDLKEAYDKLQEKYDQLLAMAKGTVDIPDTANIEKLQQEATLANNKANELSKIVESMKGQYSQLEQIMNDEKLRNKATIDFLIDTLRHAYITATMAAKGGI